MESFRRWNGDSWFRGMAIGLVLGVLGAWEPCDATPQWICMTDDAWYRAPRYDHACVVFRDQLWVIGGYSVYCSGESFDSPRYLEDVWCSSDGKHWTWKSAPFLSTRYDHASLVFHDKMWVIGGDDKNDIWCSSDGETWVQVTAHAAWSARAHRSAVVFDDKMWVLGGGVSEVWSSKDGITWDLVTDNAPWGPLRDYPSVVFNGKIWILGSTGPLSTVWSSVNGKDWIEVTHQAPWEPRYGHSAVVCQNKMWILGGEDLRNDIWYSEDGVKWSMFYCNRKIPPKAAVTEYNDTIWTLGGETGYCDFYGDAYNDVWYLSAGLESSFSASEAWGAAPFTVQFTDESLAFSTTITDWTWDFGDGTGSNEQNPNHTYAQRGVYTVSLTVASDTDTDTRVKERYIRVAGEQHAFHSADADRNGRISLSELLRVIQFYNYGAFHCAVGTEDGYAPGPGGMDCGLYDGDYAPPDGQMNLSEVLRVIQFFNVGGYRACLDGEDGFCPGAEG